MWLTGSEVIESADALGGAALLAGLGKRFMPKYGTFGPCERLRTFSK
jgi:hypothetical protein